ncbi:MAG: serine/threonine protein kinase, partial [Planctomycetes bacterium]|nr:serine/threonine protein kinase [Planctomycetota bacterium]
MNENTILVNCVACEHEFSAPQRLNGKKVNCPYCGRVLMVGDASSASTTMIGGDPLVGKTIRGCQLKKRLGAGTMGAVYSAHYIKGDRTVAVKLLSNKAAKRQDLVTRFEREARLCKDIDHPNVIDVYDIGQEKNTHYMVMEFVDGSCMAGLIDDRGKLPWKEAAVMMRKLAGALAKANELNIIHRDIKPANILISETGEPKLADLGLGKQIGNEDDHGLTMQGTAMGTPAYMAPEQIT